MAGLCFRDNSFREPELSRKERKLPSVHFQQGRKFRARRSLGFLAFTSTAHCQQPSHTLLKEGNTEKLGNVGDTESLLRTKDL